MNFSKKNNFHLPTPTAFLVSIFQRVWFVWVIVVFSVTGLCASLAYFVVFNLLSGRRAYNCTFFITRWWGRLLLGFSLVRVKTEGMNYLDKSKPYVLVSNHLSAMDIPVCTVSSPVPMSFLAKIEVDKIPFVGYLARNMHVYVDRKTNKGRLESARRMEKHLEEKGSIHIYVEGTRNRTDQILKRFYNGAFRLAIETQTPIAVLTMIGSEKIMTPKGSFRASPAYVRAVWSKPIETKGMTLDNVGYLKSLVREQMLYHLESVETEQANIA